MFIEAPRHVNQQSEHRQSDEADDREQHDVVKLLRFAPNLCHRRRQSYASRSGLAFDLRGREPREQKDRKKGGARESGASEKMSVAVVH